MSVGALWRFVKHSVRQYGADNCPQLAAAISYYVLFSIVPLTFVLVSVFGLVIRSDRLRSEVVQRAVDSIGIEKGDVTLTLDDSRVHDRLTAAEQADVRAALLEMDQAQRQQVADELRDAGQAQVAGQTLAENDVLSSYDNIVSDALSGVAAASAPFTVFSLVFGAWSASAMFGAVRKALNIIWKVPYQRAYLQQKFADLAMVTAFGLLALASVAGTGALRALREVSDSALGPLSSGTGLFWGLLPYVLPGLVSFTVFASLYRFVPAVPVRFRDVWLGAVVAAVLFEALKNGFAFYVANFHTYDLLYGSLGGILLFLTGVYFTSAILLIGGEMAAAMPGLGAGAFAPDPNRPKLGLLEQARREAVSALRSLVWMPRRSHHEADGTRTRPDRSSR